MGFQNPEEFDVKEEPIDSDGNCDNNGSSTPSSEYMPSNEATSRSDQEQIPVQPKAGPRPDLEEASGK